MSYVYCGWLDSALNWILKNVITPIFNCVKSVLSTVFNFIYNTILGPILDNTVYAVGEKIWEKVLNFFFTGLYNLAKAVLQILDCLSDIFDTLLGVQPVIFQGKETTLLRAFLNMEAVRKAFWYINFFALGLAILFAIYGVTRSMLDLDFENKRPVSRVMSSLLNSVLNLFTVQFAVFGIIYLAEAILTGLNSAVSLAGGSAGNTTLGRMIFVLGTLNAAKDESFNLSSEAVKSGSKTIGPTDSIRIKFFETGGKNPYKLRDVREYFQLYKLDYVILILLGLAFSALLLFALLAVVRRLFNLLLLYIISPLFAATIPLDDGEHFAKWRNLFVGTCFTGYGMLVAMKLYLLICPTIMGSEMSMSNSLELNFVCKVVFLLGGLWAVYKSSSMVTGLISGEAAGAEQESLNTGYELAGWAGGNLVSMLKANAKKNKEKTDKLDGKDGKDAPGAEGSQRFNGNNTGAAGTTGNHGADNAFQGDMRNRNDKLEGAGKPAQKSSKSSNLFRDANKPDSMGKTKTAMEKASLDKLRSQFDMDHADDLDKEKKPEAEQNKNKNAFQGRKDRTTDSIGLGTGKNKKSMDALRSKLGFDTAAPEAADANEDEKTLGEKNKAGTAAGKPGGQKTKVEGSKPDGKTAGGVAASGRKTKDDSGYMESHLDINALDKENGSKFANGKRGADNADYVGKNRPTLNGGSWKDTGKSADGQNKFGTDEAKQGEIDGKQPNVSKTDGKTAAGKANNANNAGNANNVGSVKDAVGTGSGTVVGEQKPDMGSGEKPLDPMKDTAPNKKTETAMNPASSNRTDISDMNVASNNKTEIPDMNVASNNKTEIPDMNVASNNKTEIPDMNVPSNNKTNIPESDTSKIDVGSNTTSRAVKEQLHQQPGGAGNKNVDMDLNNIQNDIGGVASNNRTEIPKPAASQVGVGASPQGFEGNHVDVSGMSDVSHNKTDIPQAGKPKMNVVDSAPGSMAPGTTTFENENTVNRSASDLNIENNTINGQRQAYETVDMANIPGMQGYKDNTQSSMSNGNEDIRNNSGNGYGGGMSPRQTFTDGQNNVNVEMHQTSNHDGQQYGAFGNNNTVNVNASEMRFENHRTANSTVTESNNISNNNVIGNSTVNEQNIVNGNSTVNGNNTVIGNNTVNLENQAFTNAQTIQSNINVEMHQTSNHDGQKYGAFENNNTVNVNASEMRFDNHETTNRTVIKSNNISNNNVIGNSTVNEQNIVDGNNTVIGNNTVNLENQAFTNTQTTQSNINVNMQSNDIRSENGFSNVSNEQPNFMGGGYTENKAFDAGDAGGTFTNVNETHQNAYRDVMNDSASHPHIEKKVETEVNQVQTETKEIREKSKSEKNKNNSEKKS